MIVGDTLNQPHMGPRARCLLLRVRSELGAGAFLVDSDSAAPGLTGTADSSEHLLCPGLAGLSQLTVSGCGKVGLSFNLSEKKVDDVLSLP